MADTILLTMDDLEAAVRVNAKLEADGENTVLVSAMDDVRGAVKSANPDVIILTGALHERPARKLLRLARDRSISTLGLLEETEPDPPKIAHQLRLTGWLIKPVEVEQVVATARRRNGRDACRPGGLPGFLVPRSHLKTAQHPRRLCRRRKPA